jgi:hypothetical protein
MTARKTLTIAAALLTLGLGACQRSNDEPAPVENAVEPVESPEPVATDTPAPLPAPSVMPDTNLAEETPPAIAPAPDEQMMDDASATGMTARASRDEVPTDDGSPTGQTGQK